MNRDRQSNKNVRKPYQPPARIYDDPTTPVLQRSRNTRPTSPPRKRSQPPSRREPGGKSPVIISIFIVLILLLLAATALYAWSFFKAGNNGKQTLAPISTVTGIGNGNSPGNATGTAASCTDPTKQKNIFLKQVPESQALEVITPQGTTSVVALFASRGDAWCWASRYNYNQLMGFAVYPKNGQASMVLNEEDASKANARSQGSWALVIVKGSNALVTVVSLAQAHTDASTWQGSNCIEQANYPLTNANDPVPA